MKLNNTKNIISSHDVNHGNQDLEEVLVKHDEDIATLKGNVKWLYKNGGMGSKGGGGGGGGGSTSSWYAFGTIDSYSFQSGVTNAELNFSKSGEEHDFTLSIAHPSGGSFSVKVVYNDGSKDTQTTFTLNQNNSWYYATKIKLGGNALLQITVTDQNNDPAIISMQYSTTAYSFRAYLVNDSYIPYTTTNITFDEAQTNGLKIALEYNIGVQNLSSFVPTLIDVNGNQVTLRAVSLATSKQGITYFSIVGDDPDFTKVIEFLQDTANTGTYTLQLTIDATVGSVSANIDPIQISFSLLPVDLYFKASVTVGSIYSKTQSTATCHSYYEGSVEIGVTPFYGEMKARPIDYRVLLDGVEVTDWISTTERATTYVTINLLNDADHASSVQEHLLTITGSTTFGADAGVRVSSNYYIYSKRVVSDLTWYPVEGTGESAIEYGPAYQNYWRGSTDKRGLNLNTNQVFLEMTNNSNPQNITVVNNPSSKMDVLISIGIQYSEINNEDNPVLSVFENQTSSSEGYFSVYPKRITLGNSLGQIGLGSEVPVALRKTLVQDYKSSSQTEFHLLQIYKRYLHTYNSNDYYEVCYYIDGVLEGAISNYATAQIQFNRIILHPANYFVNLLEVSYFKHSDSPKEGSKRTFDFMSDSDICRYWYKYRQLKRGEINISSEVLTYASDFELDKTLNKTSDTDYGHSQYNYIKVGSLGDIQNIAKISGVPSILFTVAESSQGQFLNWITQGYSENDKSIPKYFVQVSYSDGKSDMQQINCPGASFQISIQGSTTRGYRGKNLNLSLVSDDITDGKKYMYSPNYDPNDYNTFLPESTFTLKADVVDSSHSNNTTIGKFINENTTKFDDAINWQSGDLRNYVKNCLDGFVCLVYVAIQAPDQTYQYRYFGVYNFNLGRDSYNNLGYTNLKVLQDNINLVPGFKCYSIDSNKNEIRNTMICAEIAGNRSRFDFSQYSKSLLYQTDAEGKEVDGCMFGDIVNGDAEKDPSDILQPFVSQVARSGGYIFTQLGKTFGSYDDSYNGHVIIPGVPDSDKTQYYVGRNQVPDFTKQYRYVQIGSAYGYEIDPTINVGTPNQGILDYLVKGNEDDLPLLDLKSNIQYYTACMAFGLVDSVQKNLNIKSWNQHRFYIAFYDMDTCLGIDNEGKDTNYYAFSDYWQTTETKEAENDTDKEYHNNLYNNTNIKIYRDFSPNPTKSGFKGYDTPSSYLFAVAKYAALFDTGLDFPAQQWADWRSVSGPLRNADYFIDTYYSSHLNDVPEILLTYNYRSKYLETRSTFSGFDSVNFIKFKGRRIQQVQDWLTNRFHILDAYFNLSNAYSAIQKWENNFTEYINVTYPSGQIINERKPASSTYSTNPDVYLAQSIFGTNARVNGTIDMIVSAKEYSPLFVTDNMNAVTRYLLVDQNKYYHINIPAQGNNVYTFGGSASWKYLNSINCFTESLIVNSDLLTTLNGDSGQISEWNINMPSIKSISLTSEGYSGALLFDSSKVCPDLTDIDISYSGIALTVNGKAITTITANQCNGAILRISNCTLLDKVQLSGSFEEVSITQLPISMALNGTNIKQLSLTTNLTNKTFSIINDQSIESLNLTGFKTVTVQNCPNLKTISIGNTENQAVTSITISTSTGVESVLSELSIAGDAVSVLRVTGQGQLSEIIYRGLGNNVLRTIDFNGSIITKFIRPDVEGEQPDYLDLSPLTLITSFNIKNDSNLTAIKFNNNKNNPIKITNTFSGCTNLTRLYGHVSIEVEQCFKGLQRFTIHGNDSIWKGLSITNAQGRTLMPYEILGLASNDKSLLTLDQLFYDKEDGLCTNFSYNISTPQSMFAQTAVSLFDIYYFFSNIQSNWKNLSSVFSQTTNGRFGMSATRNNSPNINLFQQCGNVTNMQQLFYSHSGHMVLLSPSRNGETITANNGLFSPLVSLENASWMWGGYTYVCDRFVWRRTSGNYQVTNLDYFYPALIVENINTYTYMPFSTSTNASILTTLKHLRTRLGKITPTTASDPDYEDYRAQLVGNTSTVYGSNYCGNLSYFFSNLSNVTSIHAFCDGIWYIDFDSFYQGNKSQLIFPYEISTYKAVLRAKFGKGTIRLSDYFDAQAMASTGTKYNDKVRYLYHSFMVLNNYDSISSGSETLGNLGTATFNITVDTFSKLSVLYAIGYQSSGNNSSSTYLLSSFGGNGVKKYIDGATFPYDVFASNANLQQITALFYKATPKQTYTNVKLPGRMFRYHSKLTDISALFYDMAQDYQLSEYDETTGSLNFAACTSLQKLDYTFASSSTSNTTVRLTGSIPYKFFYHGGSTISGGTYTGTNQEPEYRQEVVGDDTIIVAVYTEDPPQSYSSYIKPNATITSMRYCFEHSDLDSYTNSNPEVEVNSNFNPFKYLCSGTGENKKWSLNPNQQLDPFTHTYKWSYDGSNKPSLDPNFINCELADAIDIGGEGSPWIDMVVGDGVDNLIFITAPKNVVNDAHRYDDAQTWYHVRKSPTYCCPPDLFRYCTNSCDITGVFNRCGVSGWSGVYNGTNDVSYEKRHSDYQTGPIPQTGNSNFNRFGLKGRICPYLLEPVKETTSIAYLFNQCKLLTSAYNTQTHEAYLIPANFFSYAPKVSDLRYAFSGLLIPQPIRLDNVFNQITANTLNVEGIFYHCYWDGTELARCQIQNVFTKFDVTSTKYAFGLVQEYRSTDNIKRQQFVTFSNMFKSKYSSTAYNTATDYSFTFAGYNASYTSRFLESVDADGTEHYTDTRIVVADLEESGHTLNSTEALRNYYYA